MMKHVRWIVAAAGVLAAVLPAGAQVVTPQVATPQAEPAREFEKALPWVERVAKQGPVLRLSAREVVDLAIRHNLDISLERYNGELALRRLLGSRGYYDPALSWSTAVGSVTTPLTAPAGASSIPSDQSDAWSFSPGLKQALPGGGSAALSLAGVRTLSSSLTSAVNPTYASALSVSVTQPLARGFLATYADRQIDLARLDVATAASQFRQKVTAILQQVLSQYWELEYAVSVYEARRQSREIAVVQHEAVRLRVQSGLLPPVALTGALAEIASRDRDLLQAEVQIIGAENALKQLVSDDPAAEIWQSAVVAVDTPQPDERPMDQAAAMAAARARRPELEQLRIQEEQNRVDLRFYWREKLPTVNFTASVTGLGKAGTVWLTQDGQRNPDPSNLTFGGFGHSLRQAVGFDFPGWSLGVNVQFPIGNRAASAQLEQARLNRSRLDTQTTRTWQAVMVDVRNTMQVMATQRKSLEAARVTTQLFAEQLEAQAARYRANFSSDFELRRFERDLVDARVRELRALVDLQLATIALQRATDTLLDDYGVPVQLVPRPGPVGR